MEGEKQTFVQGIVDSAKHNLVHFTGVTPMVPFAMHLHDNPNPNDTNQTSNPECHETTRQDKARKDETRQDKTRQNKIRQDKARRDET